MFNRPMQNGVFVGDHGYLDFLRAAQRMPGELPVTPVIPSNDRDAMGVVAPLWANLIPGQVDAVVWGTSPNRTLVIQGKNVAHSNAPAALMSFQVRLYEMSGVIDIIYGTVSAQAINAWGLNYGDGSTYAKWFQPTSGAAYRLTPTC